MPEPVRYEIAYKGRRFSNDYVFPAEIAALRARKTKQFQELPVLQWVANLGLIGTYLDVGAHIGNHSLFFLAFCPSTQVIAIEGHPEIRKLMLGNIARNATEEEKQKFRGVAAAAWDQSEVKVHFGEIPRNNAGHTQIKSEKSGGKTPVTTVALDDLELKDVVVLKIDVEDVEEQVLDGAKNLIKRQRPVIIIERHSKAQLDAALDRLHPHGYRIVQNWGGIHTYALRAPAID